MTLAQMESRFFELKGKLAVGQINQDEFKREIEQLRFQDGQGRWWMLGAQSGRWYLYDGSRWVTGTPPEPPGRVATEPATEPETGDRWPGTSGGKDEQLTDQNKPPTSVPPRSLTSDSSAPLTAKPTLRPKTEPTAPDQSEAPLRGMPARLRKPSLRGPTLSDRVREEMSHVHMPDVRVPVHTSDVRFPNVQVRAPKSVRRFPPLLILAGAILAGVVLVAVLWLAVDNLVPGKPISSFLGGSLGKATQTPSARATPSLAVTGNAANVLQLADELAAGSKYGSALAQYQGASKLAPNDADVYVHWAAALALTGRLQDAVSTADRAVKLNPKSAAGYAQLARALAWSGKNDEAVMAGEKAVALDDQDATAHALLAEAYLRAGRREDASREAATAVKLDNSNPDAFRAAGWIAALAGNKNEAITSWKKVTDLAPEVSFYHYEFGQVYGTYADDSNAAVSEYLRASALYAPYVPTYLALGKVYLTANQPGPAVQQFQRALTYDGNSTEAFIGLAQAFQKQGRCEQAVPYFRQALTLTPNGNDALRGLAECGALAQGQPTPGPVAPTTVGLNAVPTAVVQATVIPLAHATPTIKSAPAGSTPAPSGKTPGGRIAFSVFDGDYHLYTAKTDGSDRQLLADQASSPEYSADGSQLLYMAWGKNRGIHRIEVGGSGDEQVSLRSEDLLPSWSPDGTQFVYATRAGQGADPARRSYRIRISDPTMRPEQDPEDFATGQYPAWGPRGQIAFRDCGLPSDACGLALIDGDGGNKRTLTNINSTAPGWSPDGKLIAFTSDYGGNWDIYIITSSGGSPARLTTDAAEDGLPVFSPDGKQIAFVSHRDGQWSIWAMGIDGSNQHKLFDLGGELAGTVAGNGPAQPGQLWYEQRIDWK